MKLQLPEGVEVVIAPNTRAHAENSQRIRAGGTALVPVWDVWAYGPIAAFPKAWKHKDEQIDRTVLKHKSVSACFTMNSKELRGFVAVKIGAFSFAVDGLVPQFVVDRFPLKWAPRPLAEEVSAWLFSDKGVTIYTEQDDNTNE